MAVRVVPGRLEALLGHTLAELAADNSRRQNTDERYQSDLCDWAERHFYIPLTAKPIVMPLHQKAVLRFFFTRNPTRFPYQTLLYSTIKKSGKSTVAGVICRWFAETQTRYGEILTIGNDLEQAKDRAYKEVIRSLEMTPGYEHARERLPGRWLCSKLTMTCQLTGSKIKAIAVDAKGEAGGQPSLTAWTELWGAEDVDAKRFWDEMTPIPTVPDSLRLVETYAGYEGESELLYGLYQKGLEGHQLTAGELAEVVCRPEVPGETFQDYVDCWSETKGDHNVLIPLWSNTKASLGMYWDSGMIARRMPWQHNYDDLDGHCAICRRAKEEHEIGEPPDDYYRSQEEILPPQAYRRLHLNEWVGAESAFIPMDAYDMCGEGHKVPWLAGQDRSPIVLGADAAVTADCFGIVAVSRCPNDDDCVDIRALRKWDPKESGGVINLDEPEDFMRKACKANNVVQIAYDPYQLENTAQRLRKEQIAWMKSFSQAQDRLKADSQLFDLLIGRRLHFSHFEGCARGPNCSCPFSQLREHMANANAKLQKDEDSKLRIVRKTNTRKIDLVVALSMASAACLHLRIGKYS